MTEEEKQWRVKVMNLGGNEPFTSIGAVPPQGWEPFAVTDGPNGPLLWIRQEIKDV